METGFALSARRSYIRLDPRTKLMVLLTGSFTVLCITPVYIELLLCLFLFLLLVNYRQINTAVKMLVIYGVLLIADHLIAPYLHGAAGVLFLTVTRVGRLYMPIYYAFILLIRTTTVSEFLAALGRMHVSTKLTIPISVMFRFMPTVIEEWNAIRSAMKFRGIAVTWRDTLRHPMAALEYVLVPLLMSAAGIAGELAAAAMARGLDSERERTCLMQVRLGGTDYLIMLIGIGFALYVKIGI